MENRIWKKSLCIIFLVISTLFVFASCKATPKNNAVVQKTTNQNEEQEDARANGGVNSEEPFVAISTPEHITENIDQYKNLKITIDADVITPDATAYPVFQVSPKIFSDEQILSYIKELTGSDTVYIEYYPSKDYWLSKITKAKEVNLDNQDYMDYLQFQYDEAPAETISVPLDFSELQPELLYDGFVETKDGTVARCTFATEYNEFVYQRNMDQEYRLKSDVTDEEWSAPREPDISQDKAYEQALDYKDKLGADLELYSAEPCSAFTGAGVDSTGWSFLFTREQSGLQKIYQSDFLYLNPASLPSYAAPWGQELLKIIIDDSGLCYMNYQGASNIDKTISPTVQLEDFDIIKENVTNQLNSIYGVQTNGEGEGLDIKITKFALGMDLLAVKDQPDIGQYIPTWRVSFEFNWRNDSEVFDRENIFDAIDGTYIEPRVTTKDLMDSQSESE